MVIAIVAATFRIYGLQSKSLWTDEAWSLQFAHLDVLQILQLRDNNPPLHNLLMHFWVGTFGDTEFSIRFLSVIFGILSVIMIYRVGCLLFNAQVGVLSSILLGASVFHVQYSQEARHYTLVAFLSLLSFYFFVALLGRIGGKRRVAVGYVLSNALLLYTYPLASLVMFVQNVYAVTLFFLSPLRTGSLSIRKWLGLQFAVIMLFLPWLPILIGQVGKVQGGFWVPRPSWHSLIDTLVFYSSGSRYLLGLFLLLMIISMTKFERLTGKLESGNFFSSVDRYSWMVHLSKSGTIYFLLIWLIIPIVVPFVVSQFSSPIYWPKYTMPASLAFYILAARGIENLSYKPVQVLIILILVLLSFKNLSEYYSAAGEEQWREATAYVEANAQKGDVLLFHWADGGFNYYSKRQDLVRTVFPNNTSGDVDAVNIRNLELSIVHYDRVWLVLSHSRDTLNLIYDNLNVSRDLVDSKEWVGIKVYLFKRRDVQSERLRH